MKKFALVALVGALALAPVFASAATNSDTGPATAGGNDTQYGQGLKLTTHSDISLTMAPACTKVSADDVAFGTVTPNPSNPSASAPLNVSWVCGGPNSTIRPFVAFQSPTNQCTLKSTASTNQIPYRILDALTQASSTYTLCNPNAIDPPGYYYPVPTSESGDHSHTFYVTTSPLVVSGYAIYPVGTYTDTVSVILSF